MKSSGVKHRCRYSIRHDRTLIYRKLIAIGLSAVAIAPSLAVTLVAPAEANILQRIQGFLRGDTGGAATGRSRGGAIRDEACRVRAGADPAKLNTSAQLVALMPETQAKTTQAAPSLVVYVPFDRNTHNMVLVFELAETATNSTQRQVVSTLPLSLPETPGLVTLQFPEAVPLQFGTTYEWTFRLICQGNQSLVEVSQGETLDSRSPASQADLGITDIHHIDALTFGPTAAAGAEVSYPDLTVQQEIFGEITRVQAPIQLANALSGGDRALAYAEADIWLDMVSTLAATRSSDWAVLLAAFDLSTDPSTADTPLQPLVPER